MKDKKQKLIEFIQGEIPSLVYHKDIPDEETAWGIMSYWGVNKIEFDITLSNVLRVISKKLKNADVLNCHINMQNNLVFRELKGGLYDWNLEKDFNNQSEELYSFLYDLLELDKKI